jgi:hypothetical protein
MSKQYLTIKGNQKIVIKYSYNWRKQSKTKYATTDVMIKEDD